MDLFHKIADADSAAIRKRIIELGLKSGIDFRNVDIGETAAGDLVARGGSVDRVPALWTGDRLVVGKSAIEAALALLAK